jgi:CRP-like cAMP-binding protein
MPESLKKHIQRFVSVSEDDLSGILEYFDVSTLKKKENLLIEGSICQSNYFVSKGCLRMFFINSKGSEQTIQFAIENWWLADYHSFETQTPAGFSIQAVEPCEIVSLHHQAQEKLLQQFPVMERYFRRVHQRAHAAAQFRIKNLYDLSREELYHNFVTLYPGFVQRIPQLLLASYLGFTPEYLSEIRRKKRS